MLQITASIRPSHLQLDMDATYYKRKAHGIHNNDDGKVSRASKTLALFDDDDDIMMVKTSAWHRVPSCH